MYLRPEEVPADGGVRAHGFPTKSTMCRHDNVGNLRHGNERNNYRISHIIRKQNYLTLQLETKGLVMYFPLMTEEIIWIQNEYY